MEVDRRDIRETKRKKEKRRKRKREEPWRKIEQNRDDNMPKRVAKDRTR